MATHTYPILLWRDADGGVSGALVGDYRNAAAHAATPREVVQQFSELLDWRAAHEPWSIDPELREPELLEVKVEVRAQYQDEAARRLIPSPETILLRVPCVIGKAENGTPVCEVPTLELRFHYQSAAQLRELVRHYVKDKLTGSTPADIAGKLPPRGTWLEQVTVRDVRGSSRQIPVRDREDLQVLFTVADPVLHGRGQREIGRAHV